MSSAEFAEWIAFDRLSPIGPERADLRAGIIASTVANVQRGKSDRALSVQDFMPTFDRAAETDDAKMKAQQAAFRALMKKS